MSFQDSNKKIVARGNDHKVMYPGLGIFGGIQENF